MVNRYVKEIKKAQRIDQVIQFLAVTCVLVSVGFCIISLLRIASIAPELRQSLNAERTLRHGK
jgi:hypothetical protein